VRLSEIYFEKCVKLGSTGLCLSYYFATVVSAVISTRRKKTHSATNAKPCCRGLPVDRLIAGQIVNVQCIIPTPALLVDSLPTWLVLGPLLIRVVLASFMAIYHIHRLLFCPIVFCCCSVIV